MIKATSSRESGCQVEGSGSCVEQVNDLLNIIGGVHRSMRRANEGLASVFQKLLILNLLDLDGSVWNYPDGDGYTAVAPTRMGEA